MGRWEKPDNFGALAKLYDEMLAEGGRFGLATFVAVATRRGLLVDTDYYVPGPDELFSAYNRMAYDLTRANRTWRWVMCRETVDALFRVYVRERTTEPVDTRWFMAGGDTPIEPREQTVITPATIFGVPIRIDPAARRPMFEIEPEASKPKPGGQS